MIPDFQSVMLQYLKVLADRNEWSTQELIDNLAHKFSVTTQERQKRLPSGQKVFNHHVRRARTVFNRAGLIEQTRHGYWHITQNGLDYLLRNPNLENAIKKMRKGSLLQMQIKKLEVRILICLLMTFNTFKH